MDEVEGAGFLEQLTAVHEQHGIPDHRPQWLR